MNYSSFMPWEKKSINTKPIAESTKSTGIVFSEFNNINSSILSDRTGLKTLKQILPSVSTDNQVVVPTQIISESPVSNNAAVFSRYHIIGGAFRIFENAGNYVDALKRKGYAASIVDKNRHGLYVVSISGFGDKETAVAQLAIIRSSENPEAWLMMR